MKLTWKSGWMLFLIILQNLVIMVMQIILSYWHRISGICGKRTEATKIIPDAEIL